MDIEEVLDSYQERISKLDSEIDALEPGSKARASVIVERNNLAKAYNELVSTYYEAIDNEENRQATEIIENRKAFGDKLKSIVSGGAIILSTVIGGALAFAGIKSNQKFVKKCNDEGIYPDKNITSKDPKLPFFGRF